MTCKHFWLPHRTTLFRWVFCGRCFERRRVKFAPFKPPLDTVPDALGEAIDLGVLGPRDVHWKGKYLR